MRRTLAGILFLILLTPSLALAQVKGFVETVGFENNYRPDCWTSMVINLTPETSESGTYLIQVHQEDLDRDRPIFTRTITLTGASEGGGAKQQKFRMYFIPQPTDGGLPDARDAGSNLKDLQDRLKVSLCTTSGKWICDLPVTATVMNADPKLGTWDVRRGSKLLVCVGNGSAKPAYRDNTTASQLLGVMEDVTMVTVQPRDLPENVIGYDAVDAIVWFNADPAELRAGGDERLRAVQEYVRRGGRLVICQHSDWQRTLEFGELLPVTIDGVRDKSELEPLRSLAQLKNRTVERAPGEVDPWERIKGPFKIAHAQANVGTLVDEWVFWDSAKKDLSPYIARKPYGMGSVTWVAQDLGDPYITSRTKSGWPEVWDRVFDWKNNPWPVPPKGDDRAVQAYGPGAGVDIGFSLTRGMDLDSKTAWLITLAIVFFIAYWLLAGPGVFAYLAGKRKTELSWFMFGISAVAATLVTLLIVQLVLRGPPVMKQFSVIKVAPNQPAVVQSRIGLYIPRDGYERIELKDAAPNNVSTITAFPWNPTFGLTAPDMQGPEYVVPVVEAATSDPPYVRVPYSSTLKKFQATWVGKAEGAVEGSARLVEEGTIEGTLTNGTGVRLKNIYLAFKSPLGTEWADWMLYIPSWDAGVTIDLNQAFNKPDDPAKAFPNISTTSPEEGKRVKGLIPRQWDEYWCKPMRGASMLGSEGTRDDFNDRIRRSLPMLSLFDRLPPVRNDTSKNDRFELLRRGGRQLDLSGALAAGALIVLAEADGQMKLPFPLHVEGSRIDGSGINFYQFVLPLDHSKLAATTRPVSDSEGQ